ncbi:MAG: cation:proton antiporter [Clostridiales bacterium]|nr:cation:proton antiporter [Clostridiales bacterium]
MAYSLALIVIAGLIFNWLFEKIKLPGLLGMLIAGVLLGPWGFDLLSADIIAVSDDFRKMALIIILLRAGLGLKKETLAKVGPAALRMSIIPCILEGTALLLMAVWVFDMGWIEAGILGFAIAAVSPAVVVPAMLDYSKRGVGSDKGIPTLILAGASVDDIFAITIFTGFLGLYTGDKISIAIGGLNVILSIISGIVLGIIIGFVFVKFFNKYHIRDTKKVLVILGAAILMTALEDLLSGAFSISSLLGIMTVGFILLEKIPVVSERIAVKFGKIWILAEILLFVLVGAKVNINVMFDTGLTGLIIIFTGLVLRSVGVLISVVRCNLNVKEKIFCMIAYIPKATVQAAIGAVPLALGVKNGELILAMAVLSIVITAPIGAIGIRLGAKKLLQHPTKLSG